MNVWAAWGDMTVERNNGVYFAGMFLQFVGWIACGVGLLLIIWAFTTLPQNPNLNYGYMVAFGSFFFLAGIGLATLMGGFILIVIGGAGTALLRIEERTRAPVQGGPRQLSNPPQPTAAPQAI